MTQLLFAGDTVPNFIFQLGPKLREFGLKHDFRLLNLEGAFSVSRIPLPKAGPSLLLTDKCLPQITPTFNAASLANNHAMDYGKEGLLHTLNLCRQNNIATVGAGADEEQAFAPLIVEDCYILSVAENEFGAVGPDRAGVATVDQERRLFQAIQEGVRRNLFVVVVAHGGSEVLPVPPPYLRERYRMWVDFGARLVIGNHAHTVQGWEVYNGAHVFYSLGNFAFPFNFFESYPDAQWSLLVSADTNGAVGIRFVRLCENAVELVQDQDIAARAEALCAQLASEDYQGIYKEISRRFYETCYPRLATTSPADAALVLHYLRCDAHRNMICEALAQKMGEIRHEPLHDYALAFAGAAGDIVSVQKKVSAKASGPIEDECRRQILDNTVSKMQMAEDERDFLREKLKEHRRFLEIGSGFSTLYFSQFADHLISVEARQQWYEQIKMELLRLNSPHVSIHLFPPEASAFDAAGQELWNNRATSEGSDYGTVVEFVGYLRGIEALLESESFDMVLVDGHVRQQIVELLLKLKFRGVILLHDVVPERDYLNRPILNLPGVDVVQQVGSMMELRLHDSQVKSQPQVASVADRDASNKESLRRKMDGEESQRVLEMLTKMNEGSFLDTECYRNRKLSEILQYAGEHCLYYRDVFQQVGFNPRSLDGFDRLPLLDKAIIRGHRNVLISNQIDSMDFYAMNTGGSTGEPLDFVVSRIAGMVDTVHQLFLYRLTMQYQPGDMIVAFDGSSVPDEAIGAHKYWVERIGQDIPFGRLSYSSLYLRAETIPYYVRHILDSKPSILRGYPSFINDIAEYILENRISIPFHIKGVQLTAENAHDLQIENISKAFNTSVFFQYGHSEVCVFGYTADNTYEYLCSPFYGFTEVLDRNGKQVTIGGVGEVVVTGFYNFAMPFIRYRTGDLAIFNGDTDGIVRLGKIVGRTQDYILTENGEKVALTALIFGQHYHAFRNIQKWQLQQDIPGKVQVRIIKEDGFSPKDEMEIRSKFKGIAGVDTEFEYVNLIPLSPRGKFRFLVQNISGSLGMSNSGGSPERSTIQCNRIIGEPATCRQQHVAGSHSEATPFCVFLNTYYGAFLNSHYARQPQLHKAGYAEQKKALQGTFFGDSDFYSRGIVEAGWRADDMIINCLPLQKAWARENDFTGTDAEIVIEQIRRLRPDVVYLQDLSVATREFLEVMRPHTTLIVGQIASPLPVQTYGKGFDIIISSFPHFVKRFREMGITSYYQPLAFDPRVLGSLDTLRRDIGISFAGGISGVHGTGTQLLEYLASTTPIEFWGYGSSSLPPASPVRARHHGEVWGREMFQTLARSAITVNRHIDVAENYANNMRLFEATGCGALLITDYKDNLNELFEIGKEVVAYRSPEECAALISYFIAHPEEAAAIASAGQERTLRDHTYYKRMEQTAEIMERHLRYKREKDRFAAVDLKGISCGHVNIEKSKIKASMTSAWKNEKIPERQRALVQKELSEMYKGIVVTPYRVLADTMKQYVSPGCSVLEIGCASGYYYEILEYLLNQRVSYTGVDYSEALIDMAKSYYPRVSFHVADGAQLPFRDREFYIAISSCVLLHTPNYPVQIAETVRVAERFVIAHRTPICRRRTTQYMKKLAYGVETVEILFNEELLLAEFESHGLNLLNRNEFYASPQQDEYGVTYIFEKRG